MATYILRKGEDWYIGFPETSSTGIDAMHSAEQTRTADVAHTKDSYGNDALSVFINAGGTISLSGVTSDSTCPEAGETLSYNGSTYVITSASIAFNNAGTGAIVSLTGISRDAWATETA